MGCWDAKEKIIPPASETEKDMLLDALGYEEKQVTIGTEDLTILVKKSDAAVVGTAVVGTAIAG